MRKSIMQLCPPNPPPHTAPHAPIQPQAEMQLSHSRERLADVQAALQGSYPASKRDSWTGVDAASAHGCRKSDGARDDALLHNRSHSDATAGLPLPLLPRSAHQQAPGGPVATVGFNACLRDVLPQLERELKAMCRDKKQLRAVWSRSDQQNTGQASQESGRRWPTRALS